MWASIRAFLWRLIHLVRCSGSESSFERELEFHLRMEISENLRRGMNAEEARRQALIAIGGMDQTKEACREASGIRWIDEFHRDLAFGVRILRKKPGFAAMVVMVLALGIGANTAFFSILNALYFKPLPYPDSDRLVLLGEALAPLSPSGPVARSSYATFVDWSRHNQVFEGLAAYQTKELNVAGGDEARRIKGDRVSSDYFRLFRIQPGLGRTFLSEDFAPERHPVAILSYRYWQTSFGGRSDIVGQVIRIDGQATTIVGVMPELFRSLPMEGGSALWIPLVASEEESARAYNVFMVMGRLKNGVALESARNSMSILMRHLVEQHPKEYAFRFYPPSEKKDWCVRMEGVHRSFAQKGTAGEGKLLMAAFGLFLLIACANVANLLLAQGTDRRKEIGVRIAMGAGRLRVIRQLMAESLLLALLGGTVGVLLARWSLSLFIALSNPFAAFGVEKFEIDSRMLLFTLAVSVACSFVFGIVPALTSTRVEPLETLKNFASGYSSVVRRRRLSGILVVWEFALSLLLLSGGGFVLRGLFQLWNFNWGFPLENRLAVTLSLAKSSTGKEANRKPLFGDFLSEVRTLPGVRSAALMLDLPIMWQGASTRIDYEKDRQTDDRAKLTASCEPVSPDYWRTLGIPLKKGRFFTEQDVDRDVAIVSESMAREVWAGQETIGKKVRVYNAWYTVVGISSDVVNLGFVRKPEYAVYLPSNFTEYSNATLVLHTDGDPVDLTARIRDIIKRMDPDQPVTAIRTLKDARDELARPWAFLIVLLGSIAAAAVVVSGIGMYGVTSRSVTAQTREIGIRMALGASSGSVVGRVVRNGARWAITGIGFGLAAAILGSKVLSSQFWWLASSQVSVIVLLALLLGIIALLACYLPARRASRIEPSVTLRAE
ncbi:MAG: ABC transporter permease [Acidobacteriia bacterium]|nr:ABC transporter permease [Terriglobia bacterium]